MQTNDFVVVCFFLFINPHLFCLGKKSVEKNLPWQEALQLREKTHFDATYIEVLYEQFKSLCSHEKGITKDVFHVCLGPLTSKRNLVVEQLFRFYDSDGDGFINFDDFVHGMSIMAKGMKSERIKYVFKGSYLSRKNKEDLNRSREDQGFCQDFRQKTVFSIQHIFP